MSGCFTSHVLMRQPMKFVMNERHQLLEGSLVAIVPFLQKPGDLMRRSFH